MKTSDTDPSVHSQKAQQVQQAQSFVGRAVYSAKQAVTYLPRGGGMFTSPEYWRKAGIFYEIKKYKFFTFKNC
jgi:hypothetical protein